MFPFRETLEVEDVFCKPAICAFSFGFGKLDSSRRGMEQRPGAMHLRQLGLPVHRERAQSSTPMVSK
eukprot:6402862-Karenia_brevis.AAC.1